MQSSLVCFTPFQAEGNTWWDYCSDEWGELLKSDNSIGPGKIWLIIVSIAFGVCLLIALTMYIVYSFKRNDRLE